VRMERHVVRLALAARSSVGSVAEPGSDSAGSP
jgi:hypothetical protein